MPNAPIEHDSIVQDGSNGKVEYIKIKKNNGSIDQKNIQMKVEVEEKRIILGVEKIMGFKSENRTSLLRMVT